MIRYAHILSAFLNAPLAMDMDYIMRVSSFLRLKAAGGTITATDLDATRTANAEKYAARAGDAKKAPGSVAVLPAYGVISQRIDAMDDICGGGGTSTERFAASFRAAVADDNIKAIIMDVDSPGGSVYGVPELAAEIFELRGSKPIIAQVNSLAASAAYWLATAADEIVVTPSGEVGSIGVYSLHEDISKFLEQKGVKETFVYAGKHKVEGNPFEPLADEARAAIQARVDDYYGMFIKAVARGRGVSEKDVRGGFGQGRVVGAAEATKIGMADRVATLAETLERFGVKKAGAGAKAEESAPTPRADDTAQLAREAAERQRDIDLIDI